MTATATPSASPTARTQAGGPLSIIQLAALAQPQRGPLLLLALDLSSVADHVRVRIYTPALVLAADIELDGAWGPGWCKARASLPRLPGGLYYARVWAAQGGALAAPRTAKLYILN